MFDYRPPRYFAAVKFAAMGAAAISLVCALYVGIWFFMAGQMRDGTLDWIEQRRGENLEIKFQQLDIGGFPFALNMVIDAPSIATSESSMPWGWEGERITASMRPWRPGRVTIDSPGEHAILITQNGLVRPFHGQAERLSATLTFNGGWPTEAEVDIAGLVVRGSQKGETWRVGRAEIDAHAPPANDDEPDKPVVEVRLRIGGFGVPARINLPLGPAIERLEISADLIRPILGGPLENALTGWRDDGGTINVQRLSGAYGPLTMTADGTMALDGDLQPIGAFTARVEGFFETIDALRERGIIQARDAITAKMVLGVMSRRSGSGRSGLNLPLTIQERRLFAGPVPLAEIPEIFWSSRPGDEPGT